MNIWEELMGLLFLLQAQFSYPFLAASTRSRNNERGLFIK